jgi:hypothetical protein
MSRLDDLPPDQRATLSLLLNSRKTYAEVAALLNIQERAVHDRAHAALAVLAVRQARALSAERRAEVGDYLLGQRTGVAERLATRTYLQNTPAARAWAAALADELAPLAGDSLAQIPGAAESLGEGDDRARAIAAEPAPAPEPAPSAALPKRSRPSAASSRTGGAVLLALLIAAVVVAVVLIADSGGGSSGEQSSSAAAGATTGTTPASSTGSTAATSTNGAKAKEEKRITLRPPDPSGNAAGVAEVLSEGKQYAFYLAAEHLPPSKGKGFFYAVWLYNSPTSHKPLGRSPEVGANGSLQGGALLPADAGSYHTMLLTRETSTRPNKPGAVVLRGSFALH